MPTARAICARRVIDSSTLLVSTIIRSANSSMTITIYGSGRCSSSSWSSKSESDWPFDESAVVLVDVAHAALRQQFQAALHFARGVAQHVGGDFRIGDHRREQVRDVFVKSQFEPLGIDHHQLQLVRRGLVQHATRSANSGTRSCRFPSSRRSASAASAPDRRRGCGQSNPCPAKVSASKAN